MISIFKRTFGISLAISTLFCMAIAAAQAPQTPDGLIATAITNTDASKASVYDFSFQENWQVSNASVIFGQQQNNLAEVPTTTQGRTGATSGALSRSGGNYADDTTENNQTSYQYNVTFIGHVPLRHLVGMNGGSLSFNADKAETARYNAEYAKVLALQPGQRSSGSIGRFDALQFDPRLIKANYTCTFDGQKKISKIATTVVHCVPNPGAAANLPAGSPHPTNITLWIDKEEPFFVQTHMDLGTDIGPYGKNTTITVNYEKINGAWHQSQTDVKYVPSGVGKPSDMIDTFSHFKRLGDEPAPKP